MRKMRSNLSKVSERASFAAIKMEQKARNFAEDMARKLQEDDGNWVEEGLKYVIAIVIGGVLLAGLISIFKVELLEGIKKGIQDLFNYKAA